VGPVPVFCACSSVGGPRGVSAPSGPATGGWDAPAGLEATSCERGPASASRGPIAGASLCTCDGT